MVDQISNFFEAGFGGGISQWCSNTAWRFLPCAQNFTGWIHLSQFSRGILRISAHDQQFVDGSPVSGADSKAVADKGGWCCHRNQVTGYQCSMLKRSRELYRGSVYVLQRFSLVLEK